MIHICAVIRLDQCFICQKAILSLCTNRLSDPEASHDGVNPNVLTSMSAVCLVIVYNDIDISQLESKAYLSAVTCRASRKLSIPR